MRPGARAALACAAAALLPVAACGGEDPAYSEDDVAVCETTVRVLSDYAAALETDDPAAASGLWDAGRADLAEVEGGITLGALRAATRDVVDLPDTGPRDEPPTDAWLRLSAACNAEGLP